MPASDTKSLGRLTAVHGLAAAQLQRAVFIAVLSFIFFLAMLLVFYARQNILYFLLSTAFLIVYLLTMFSWVMQRRHVVQVYENGIAYKKQSALWSDVVDVHDDGTVIVRGSKPFVIPNGVTDLDALIKRVRQKAELA